MPLRLTAQGRVLLAPPGGSGRPLPTPSFYLGVSLLLFSSVFFSRGGLGAGVCLPGSVRAVVWGQGMRFFWGIV